MDHFLTLQLVIQTYIDGRHIATTLFGILLNGVGENIVTYSASAWRDVLLGNLLSLNVIVLIGVVVFGFFLIKNNLLRAIRYVIGH